MNNIFLENIRPGMVLAQDVHDCNGRFLLSKGLNLSEKHLRILKIWGVSELAVCGSDFNAVDIDQQFSSKKWKKAVSMVLRRFPDHEPRNDTSLKLVNIFAQQYSRNYRKVLSFFDRLEILDSSAPLKKSSAYPLDPSSIITDNVKLPCVPQIFKQFFDASQDLRTSSRYLTELVGSDPGLSAMLLKLVNNSAFGLSLRIDSISKAVKIVGARQLSMLADAVSVFSRFKNISPKIINMPDFWKHSLACAVGAKTLAQHCGLPDPENIFVCGLLHDLGRLFMLTHYPFEILGSVQASAKEGSKLHDAEKLFFHLDHAALGAMLARKWQLPDKIEQTIRYHHHPYKSVYRLEATLVNMADTLSIGCDIGCSGNFIIPGPDLDSWTRLKLDPYILSQTAKIMQSQVDNFEKKFFY